MDTGKEYIKMCEKTEEIQKEWKPTGGDFYSTGWNLLTIEFVVFYESLDELITGQHSKQIKKDIVWLPRQDQLQAMVRKRSIFALCCDISEFCNDVKHKSMEQLWLGFVMEENYKKVWNSKEWVKEKNDG